MPLVRFGSLGYIADRVLQSSYDMFNKNKDDTLDELSALGLRHVGYGIPIELFGPFAEVCVDVMRPMVQEFPNKSTSTEMVWCPKDNAHQLLGDRIRADPLGSAWVEFFPYLAISFSYWTHLDALSSLTSFTSVVSCCIVAGQIASGCQRKTSLST